MRKGIKVALDPTPRQEQALWSHAGAARAAPLVERMET